MPSPVSQIVQLYNNLRGAPTLAASWMNVRVLLGARNMAKSGNPPRVVLFPTEGAIKTARDLTLAIRDVDRIIVAHLWGRDFDELQELEARFFQALDYQASPQPSNPSPTVGPGLYWQATREDWDVTQDSDKNGESVFVTLASLNSIDKIPPTTGQVLVTLIQSVTTTLTAQLGSTDTTASVASILSIPTSGYVQIDSETIRYTGISATATTASLTGLVRGSNGTTAATHANAATVTPVAHL